MNKKIHVSISLLFLFQAFGAYAQYTGGFGRGDFSLFLAAPTVWNGSKSSEWSDAANWDTNVVPSATVDVVIPSESTFGPIVNLVAASPASCRNLTIEQGATLTIAPNKALTVNGTLTNSAGITGLFIQSNARGSGSLINGTNGVMATVEHYMTGDIWHTITPVATGGEKIISFLTLPSNMIVKASTFYTLASFLEKSMNFYKDSTSASGNFDTPAKGYIALRSPIKSYTGIGKCGGDGPVSFRGILAANGQSFATTKTGSVSTNGWNLIGNPYPCGLDIDAFLAANRASIDPDFFFIYQSNVVNNKPTNVYVPYAPGLKLSSGEGFFVKSVKAGATIIFTPTMKKHVSSTIWNGTKSSDWSDAANWDSNVVPSATVDVVIPSESTFKPIVNLAVSSPAVCSNLTIEQGATLTIAPNNALTVNGTLTNSAGITGLFIQSDARGSGSLINGTNGVMATVEHYMTGDIWHTITPIATAGEKIISFLTLPSNMIVKASTFYTLASFLEKSMNFYKDSTSASGKFDTPAKGYIALRSPIKSFTGIGKCGGDGPISFKGILAANGQSIATTKTGSVSTNGWNLIGNPYPCGLDIDAFLAANRASIDTNFFFIYNSNVVNNKPTNVYVPYASGLKLSSGEGFFVKSVKNGATIIFTPAMKKHISNTLKSGTIEYPTIKLTVDDGGEKLETTVQYVPGTTIGLDPGKDAGLFKNGEPTFSLFTKLVQDNSVDFAIQALPNNNYENMVVPVGLVASKGAQIIFTAELNNFPNNYKVYLEDKITCTFTSLNDVGSSYTVTLDDNLNGTGRFYLHTNEIISVVYPENPTSGLTVIPLPKQSLVRVIGDVTLPSRAMVYDLNGKLVTTAQLISTSQNDIPLINQKTGVYLLKLQSGKINETKKFIWKNL